MSNDEIVALVGEHSKGCYKGDLARDLRYLNRALARSGLENRYWLSEAERAEVLVKASMQRAVEQARLLPGQVDAVISASVDRVLIEPANAYALANAGGFRNAQCFDVLDACNGWARAIQVAGGLLATGQLRNALIVNAEFGMWRGGPVWPKLFRLENRAEMMSSFAGFTLGEGVAATVLTPGENRWTFRFSSRADLLDLCTVTLPGHRRVSTLGTESLPTFAFRAQSAKMIAAASAEISKLLSSLSDELGDVRVAVPHGATWSSWHEQRERFAVLQKLFHIYPEYGNLVSAAIPGTLAKALDAKKFSRGDKVLVCGASAGMAFSAVVFEF